MTKTPPEEVVFFYCPCPECGRVFDLTDETQADEFYSGHDCEELTMTTIKQYLARNGYTSVEDWAIDSDFTFSPQRGWVNDEGHPTDIIEYLAVLITEGHTQ